MANMGDGRAPYKNRRATEKNNIKEEPWNVSEAGQNSILEEQNAARVESLKAYKRRTISIDQALMENLPDELLLDIFIRLLAKQLVQMRSVSKSWNALLSQSSFVKSHLDRSIHSKDQTLLVFKSMTCSCDCKSFTAHSSRSPHLELTEFNKLPPVNPKSGLTNTTIRIIGAVDGLICSSYGDSVIHIWNPSLSAVLTLPPYSMPSLNSYVISLRFGFDPKTDDYKVVKVANVRNIEVFSMRKGSWEFIMERLPSHISWIFDHDFICADGHDGHLHWIGYYIRGIMLSKTIVSFDLSSHTFSEIFVTISFMLGSFFVRKALYDVME